MKVASAAPSTPMGECSSIRFSRTLLDAPMMLEMRECIVFWLASYIELRKLLKLWNTTAATRNGT